MRESDPTVLAKAIKNAAEQQGHRDAQARDGAAVSRFLRWLSIEAPSGGVDELTAAAKLREFRGLDPAMKDSSFDTISAAGPHAALPHYKVDDDSNIPIPPSQHLSRRFGRASIWAAPPTSPAPCGSAPANRRAEMIDRNTRVLKGHIELARATFPKGTNGGQLDTLARIHLWAAGVDYGHGTGHGVGSYLSVHEGPQRISKSGGAFPGTDTPIAAGMILSNEPGYYKQGAFGIRIENLVLTVPRGHRRRGRRVARVRDSDLRAARPQAGRQVDAEHRGNRLVERLSRAGPRDRRPRALKGRIWRGWRARMHALVGT